MRLGIVRYLFGRNVALAASMEVEPQPQREECSLSHRVMAAYNTRGLAGFTADEVADVLGMGVLSVRPTVTRLFQTGKLRRTGTKRKNRSGLKANVLVSCGVPSAA